MSWKDEIKKQFHQDENGAWLFTEIDGDHEYTVPFKEMTLSAIKRYDNFIEGYGITLDKLKYDKYNSSVYIQNRIFVIHLVFKHATAMNSKLMEMYRKVCDNIIPEEKLVDFRISNQPLEEYINGIAMPALYEIKTHMEDIDYIEDGLKEIMEEEESSEDISLDSIIFAKELQRRKE